MTLRWPDGTTFTLDRPRIMGILNVTPDSFSDGGAHDALDAAVARGIAMVAEGADVIDIGGESTRPGAGAVNADEQKRRVVPVIQGLRNRKRDMAISVDTSLVEVAEAALDAGALMINDVYAGRDPRNPSPSSMFELAAKRGVPICLMHMRGTPATMQQGPTYQDVVAEVEAFLLERAAAAQAAGVRREQIVLDPGIGFGKTKAHNLTLLAHLDRFVASGYPVLLGASRKRFMGSISQLPDGSTPPPQQLVGATCATTALGVAAGVRIFRVHDVLANRQAADVAWAVRGISDF